MIYAAYGHGGGATIAQVGSLLRRCIVSELEKLHSSYRFSLPRELEGHAWETFEWQRTKRLIARALARCLCRAGCHVYLGDFHGGEPSSGMGGKDIDLVLDCDMSHVEDIERVAEEAVASWLAEKMGINPYRVLGVPNLVELHTTSEYIFRRYVEAGEPYVFMLC